MSPAVEIESRETVPRWLAYGAPLLTILAALVVAAIPLLWIDVNPVLVYDQIFLGTPSDIGGIADILTTATPLFLAGLS